METSKKVWASAIAFVLVAGVLLVRFGALADTAAKEGVNVSMPAATTLQVFLGGSGANQVSLGNDEGSVKLGSSVDAITNLTALTLSEDLVVGGATTMTGNQTVSGALTVTGTSTFNGAISGNVPARATATMTTATTTPCAIQNASASDRTLVAIGVSETTYAGAGTVGLTVGTSTTAFVTSTSPLISNLTFANSASQNIISTTSTLSSAYANWKSGEWLVFKTTTGTNAGTCRALYY